MIGSLIGALITGAIVGYLGRAILPGAQNIGWLKTVGIGVVAAVVVGAIASGAGWLVSTILAALAAAGILWLVIRQGWVKPSAV